MPIELALPQPIVRPRPIGFFAIVLVLGLTWLTMIGLSLAHPDEANQAATADIMTGL